MLCDDQQVARVVLPDCPDPKVRQPVCDREGLELAVLVAHQPAIIGTHPQSALAIFVKRSQPVAAAPFGVGAVEDGEAHTVEAYKSVRGGEPEIAVAGLEDRLHGVLWQAAISRP